MGKIKKQFKDFWQYFRLIQRGAGTAEAGRHIRGYIPAFIIIIVALILTSTQMGLTFTIMHGVFIGSAMGVGITTAVKPSALSVAPFSPKQRVVFSFFSTLLMAIIASFFIFAISMVFVLFIAFIAFCVDGENIFESALPAENISAYGYSFAILVFILFFFVTYAIFHLERKRNVVIASAVFLAVMVIFTLVMTNLCSNAIAQYHNPQPEFHFSSYANVPDLIVFLSLPWLPILILCIMNALAIAGSIVLSIKRFKSDKV